MDDLRSEMLPFDHVFEEFPCGVLIVARDGRVCALNGQMRQQVKDLAGNEPAPGCDMSDIFEEAMPRLLTDMIAAASGMMLTLHLHTEKAGGPEKYRFNVRPLSNDRSATLFLLVQNKSQSFENAFSLLTHQLKEANEASAEMSRRNLKLKDRFDEMERFSYVAAHDLKAPLRNISTLLEILKEDYGATMADGAKELIAAATGCAAHLSCLISDLLDHAKAGTVAPDKKDLRIRHTVDAVAENLAATIKSTKARLKIVGDLGLASADSTLFQQLLENVISNAIKYRSPNRTPVITISRQIEDGSDRLVIRDNGLGFDNTYKSIMFEPFRRLHTNSPIEGNGVGLSTCQVICDRHGWKLDADGKPGQGSEFRIMFT